MRALLFLPLALAASAIAQPGPTPKHFSDADLEAIFAHVLSLPPTRNPAPEPSTKG
jgi:hypothetical protein